ncbi:MAG: nuclear transport factor 2 family protein [Chitinophagaceae bacterium]
MKPCLLILALFCLPAVSPAQKKDEAVIRDILATQTAAWNRGSLEKFMEGYWKNDSLMFIGKSGVTYGWQNTLDNYRKGYPDTSAMGQLHFDIIQVKRLSPEYYQVTGKWTLKRTIGDLTGHFTLIFHRIGGTWVIISDHSS